VGSDAAAAVNAVWRRESVRLVAGLARMTHDLELAEDLAQDALVAALEQWPAEGIPQNPGAWLMAVAKRRGVDHFRRIETLRRRTTELGHALEEAHVPDLDAAVDHIEDDVLRLMFLTCHPVLSPESRAALTLRLVGGLTTEEIARAFLVKDSTMGQRISRAKKALVGAGFELPVGRERRARLTDVMGVVYLVFNEGYTATSGDRWIRSELCAEAQRLGRMLASLTPNDPETLGLLALIEIQASRLNARTGPGGEPVLLLDQDRTRWDRLLIRRGLAHIDRIQQLGGTAGPYALQAAIAACHARAPVAEETDWPRIVALYDGLAQISPSPVVELNRGVAAAQAFGPQAGLDIVAPLFDVPSMRDYHLLPAVAGDLLCRSGEHEQARQQFLRSASLTRNDRERSTMQQRAAQCAEHGASLG